MGNFFINNIVRYVLIAVSMFLPMSVFAATLSLSPVSGTYTIGDEFSVNVYLNTESIDIAAVDLELTYPADLLSVVDNNSSQNGVQIMPGSLMPEVPLNIIENNKVRFAQLAYAGQPFSNNEPQLFATISFRAIASGIAPLTILHTLGNTRDSNVAVNGTDILSGVTNASFSILTSDGQLLTSSPSYSFTRDLTIGSRGEDVLQLQKFLNTNGFTVSVTGPGAPGSETDYFGSLTNAAVARFQEAYTAQILLPVGLSKGTGYFGPSTRKQIHALVGSGGVPQPQQSSNSLQQQIQQLQEQVNALLQQLGMVQ